MSRVDARKMIAVGFACLALALVYMSTHLSLGIDFKTTTMLRVYQSFRMAFLFVPISTLSYVGVPNERNNAVAGMVNLSRNMGGDIGIAFVTTMLARRARVHQVELSAHTTSFDGAFTTAPRGAHDAARSRRGAAPRMRLKKPIKCCT